MNIQNKRSFTMVMLLVVAAIIVILYFVMLKKNQPTSEQQQNAGLIREAGIDTTTAGAAITSAEKLIGKAEDSRANLPQY